MTDIDRLTALLMAEAGQFIGKNGTLNCSKLAEKLLEHGVIVPPVKIGEEVWIVYTPKYPANPNDKGKRFVTQEGVQRIICGAKGLSIETWNMGTISAKEFGKTIFLTEEEAEQTLNTFQNGKGGE